MKPELIKRYRTQSFSRWAKNETNYEKLVELVVLDVLEVIQTSKPSKTQLTQAIKQYFGMEAKNEQDL
ncbi:hypothetical protein EB118_13080 [bacterium]|nr:hypothetical protein [bacterium]